MVCEPWKTKLDTYLDGELPSEEMSAFDTHVHSCPYCASDALTRVQMKRSIQAAGKRFTPSAEFRKRMRQSIEAKPRRSSIGFAWMMATAVFVILVVVGLTATYMGRERAGTEQVYSEVADLHVATLASSSPVDVISSDRHTVKPWFQGKIPFAFDLPEIQNSEFSLLGGRMAYLDQTPGAHLIYQVRKHDISVFIFQEGSLRGKVDENSPVKKNLSATPALLTLTSLRSCSKPVRRFKLGDVVASVCGSFLFWHTKKVWGENDSRYCSCSLDKDLSWKSATCRSNTADPMQSAAADSPPPPQLT